MALKLTNNPVFIRNVEITTLHPTDADRTQKGTLRVTYNDLDDEQTEKLADDQAQAVRKAAEEASAGAGSGVNLNALRLSLDAVVNNIEGLEVDGQVLIGADALAFVKKQWSIGKQINDLFWVLKRDPKKRVGN
jgi:hypothetical protein